MKVMQTNSLIPFIIKVFLWLPICYWGWFFAANTTTIVTAYLTELVLTSSFPQLISSIEQIDYHLDIIVKVTMPSQQVPKGMVAEIAISINPLIYNYGLPLCMALILASPASLLKTFINLIISVLLLLPIQIWGICFEFMKVLFLQTPSQLTGNIILYQWQLDTIAIGYQMGALVLPVVTPIIIWLSLYRNFIVQFVPALRQIET